MKPSPIRSFRKDSAVLVLFESDHLVVGMIGGAFFRFEGDAALLRAIGNAFVRRSRDLWLKIPEGVNCTPYLPSEAPPISPPAGDPEILAPVDGIDQLDEPMEGAKPFTGIFYRDETALLIRTLRMLNRRENHFVSPVRGWPKRIFLKPKPKK